MTRLPVLYVLDPTKDGHIHAMPSPEQFVGYEPSRIFEYEPAVPRCKTCEYFCTVDETLAACDRMRVPRPVDGSGYCDCHPEARR